MSYKKSKHLIAILDRLEVEVHGFPLPLNEQLVVHFGRRDPFMILISCLLSLRARDSAVFPIACKLFEKVSSPQELLLLSDDFLFSLLYSIGFYKKKTHVLQRVCLELIKKFDGNVPHARDELLSLHGVGVKTAALVLSEGFCIPALCVDTHVIRISRAIGVTHSMRADVVENDLMNMFPRERWRDVNRLFVMYGQNLCKPWTKNCNSCARSELCAWLRSFFSNNKRLMN